MVPPFVRRTGCICRPRPMPDPSPRRQNWEIPDWSNKRQVEKVRQAVASLFGVEPAAVDDYDLNQIASDLACAQRRLTGKSDA